jgi:ABC-type phosphate transport system permease subunit
LVEPSAYADSFSCAGTTRKTSRITEADTDLYLSSLIGLGFILFVVTFIVLAAAKLMLLRIARQKGE